MEFDSKDIFDRSSLDQNFFALILLLDCRLDAVHMLTVSFDEGKKCIA
jgi:hypothetical protein